MRKGNFWGRLKRPSEGWVLWWWDLNGRSLGDQKESENDLIQEPELAKKTPIQWNGDNRDAIYDFIYSGVDEYYKNLQETIRKSISALDKVIAKAKDDITKTQSDKVKVETIDSQTPDKQ